MTLWGAVIVIHGYHLILPAYGFWLPNDPRGSWSEAVRKWELVRFGSARKTIERRSLDSLSERELASREAAKRVLRYPPVHFSGTQSQAIAAGFAQRAARSNYTLWACAILPEHTHLVVARHTYIAERIAIQLKAAATRELMSRSLHPFAQFAKPGRTPPKMWAANHWKVYLDSEESIVNAIQYVNANPQREHLPSQHWSFVAPFQGLLPGGWITYH